MEKLKDLYVIVTLEDVKRGELVCDKVARRKITIDLGEIKRHLYSSPRLEQGAVFHHGQETDLGMKDKG